MAQRKLTEKDTLGFLGEVAQMKIVKSLIENHKLYLNTHNYINPNSFTTNELRTIIGIMDKYYGEKGIVPSYKDIEYILKDKCKSDSELESVKDVFMKIKNDNLNDGLGTATEIGINYFKKMEMIRVLTNGLANIKGNNYTVEKLNHIQEELSNIEKNNVDNEDVMAGDLLDVVFNTGIQERIPTHIIPLDEAMNGGLPKKNIGLIIAGTGIGKTTLGAIMCIGAACYGYNVLHIFFEDTLSDIGQKYYAWITGRNTKEFTKENPNRETLGKEILSIPEFKEALFEHLKPVRMTNGATTVEDIKNYINNLINVKGWKPDMVFIDYLSCLQTTTNETLRMQNECQAFERTMKRLETMAQDLDIAIWVEQQTNRDAFKDDTANNRIGNVQGSFRITQPASFILYLKRDSFNYNSASLYMDKCRGCTPKAWEGIYFDNGICRIDLNRKVESIPFYEEDDKEELEFKIPETF